MAIPRCAFCNTQGLDNIAAENKDSFKLVYCNTCGAIFGVVPVESEKIRATPLEYDDNQRQAAVTTSEPDSLLPPRPARQKPAKLPPQTKPAHQTKEAYSPERMHAKMRAANLYRPAGRYMRVVYDDGPPVCPLHKADMKLFTIPDGYEDAGRQVWRCPEHGCYEWEFAE